jgi:putative multicomponent Na+:H+ antiporter subunit B
MTDLYIYVIAAVLPLAAGMLVLQSNPYHALVLRGILGAVAALVYSVLGAADVALTEELVGTMLIITLYAVAVRSSLVMRLGVIVDSTRQLPESGCTDAPLKMHNDQNFQSIIDNFRTILKKYHVRLELVSYANSHELHQALNKKEIHATCIPLVSPEPEGADKRADGQKFPSTYHTAIRIRRLHEIISESELPLATTLSYAADLTEIDTGTKEVLS